MCWKWCFASFFGEGGHWTLDEVCHLIFYIVKITIFQTKWKENWMGAILHIKAFRVSMVSKWHQIWSRSGDVMASSCTIGSLGSLQMALWHRLQGTSSWKKHLNWHHGNICGQRTKSETCLEALRMSQDDQSHVSLWLFVAMQLVGKRQRFGWTWLGENHRGVEPSDQTGGRFKWLWWLLNYNLGSQGARVLGESLATFQHGSNNLGSQGARVLGQSPNRRLAQRFGFFEPRSLEFRLLWKTRNFLLFGVKKGVYWWRVYSSCWNFLFVRLIGPCSFEAVICLFVNVCYWC